jgi:hypothetical protein
MPKMQADASAWWQQTYGYYLNSSTVSEILGYKYDSLDAGEVTHEALRLVDERKRHRDAKWVDLEDELIRWVFERESMTGEGSVTSSMLRQKATELWYQMPCYHNMRRPRWSEGWRSRFTARYKLRQHSLLREATSCTSASTDLPASSPQQASSVYSATASTTRSGLTPGPYDLAELINSWNDPGQVDLWDTMMSPDMNLDVWNILEY